MSFHAKHPTWPPSRETLDMLYTQSELSTHKIAKQFGVNAGTVRLRLKKLEIPLRERVSAYVKAVTKYQKRPFSGSKMEAAYMIGLRLSDFDARWAKRIGGVVVMRTRTTRWGMIQLAHKIFGQYGHVAVNPRRHNRGGHCWEVECYLDFSFDFLVPKPQGTPDTILCNSDAFLHHFAALVDGDGWVGIDNCWGVRATAKVGFCNTERRLVEDVVHGLSTLGHVVRPLVNDVKGRVGSYGVLNNDALRVQLKCKQAVKLLNVLPLCHPEKVARKTLALQLHGKPWEEAKPEWNKLLAAILSERDNCVAAAKKTYLSRKCITSSF